MDEKYTGPVWGKPEVSYDWCGYAFDGDMITVRKKTITDVAKFKTKAEALGFIEFMEKSESSNGQ